MQELLIAPSLHPTIHTVPLPPLLPGHILIRVHSCALNPKDWKVPSWSPRDSPPKNHGDDLAGYVEAIGQGASGSERGDRVAGLHELGAPYGTWAEYALVREAICFKIPESVVFEEAATIPLAAMSASLALYQHLSLPLPWSPSPSPAPLPLLIYGASSTVGAFAIKLARLSGIHPLIAVAGKGLPFVSTLLDPSRGDVVVDYRHGREALLTGIHAAAKGCSIRYAVDAISETETLGIVAEVLDRREGKLVYLLPGAVDKVDLRGLEAVNSTVGRMFSGRGEMGRDGFAAGMFRFLGRAVGEGKLAGHPWEVVDGGLGGIERALRILMEGRNSAVKYVVRIGDTEGIKM